MSAIRNQITAGRPPSLARRIVLASSLGGCIAWGCGKPAANSSPAPAAPPASGGPAVSAGDAAAPAAGAVASPEPVQKVEELIRLTKRYNELASTVQDAESFQQKRDELLELESQLSSLTEDVMIAQSKMTAAEQAEFDAKYYVPQAKPAVEEMRNHKRRIAALSR